MHRSSVLGLMLENVSPRLCDRGMPHHRAPDKRPHRRIAMLEAAGALGIPFTTGLLIGIGETREERWRTLVVIAELHAQYGHIQEVIIQSFRARPEIPMAHAPEAADTDLIEAIALARLLLPDDVSLQAPPNLNPHSLALLLQSGINDFGGISPVTPDFINPNHPWPHIDSLRGLCASQGFALRPRLPVYDRFTTAAAAPRFLDEGLHAVVARAHASLAARVSDSVSASAHEHPRSSASSPARSHDEPVPPVRTTVTVP
jgi:FO synthase